MLTSVTTVMLTSVWTGNVNVGVDVNVNVGVDGNINIGVDADIRNVSQRRRRRPRRDKLNNHDVQRHDPSDTSYKDFLSPLL